MAVGGADTLGISRLKTFWQLAVMSPTAGNMVRFAMPMRPLHIFCAVFFCMTAADVRRRWHTLWSTGDGSIWSCTECFAGFCDISAG